MHLGCSPAVLCCARLLTVAFTHCRVLQGRRVHPARFLSPSRFFCAVRCVHHERQDYEQWLCARAQMELSLPSLCHPSEQAPPSILPCPCSAPFSAGAIYKYDVSMPIHAMYQLVEDMRDCLAAAFPQQAAAGAAAAAAPNGAGGDGGSADGPPIRVAGYGHLGDGNLHLNISGGQGRAAGPPPSCAGEPAGPAVCWSKQRVPEARAGGALAAGTSWGRSCIAPPPTRFPPHAMQPPRTTRHCGTRLSLLCTSGQQRCGSAAWVACLGPVPQGGGGGGGGGGGDLQLTLPV